MLLNIVAFRNGHHHHEREQNDETDKDVSSAKKCNNRIISFLSSNLSSSSLSIASFLPFYNLIAYLVRVTLISVRLELF
jgi:hypothetical protein